MSDCGDSGSFSELEDTRKETDTEKYIMHPKLYKDLMGVNGFTNLNGDNYMKHICIIFDKDLNSQQKIKMLSCKTNTQALNKLTLFGIKYTHNYQLEL